jgi:hypothetical protein
MVVAAMSWMGWIAIQQNLSRLFWSWRLFLVGDFRISNFGFRI